jgi:hypothetical protein
MKRHKVTLDLSETEFKKLQEFKDCNVLEDVSYNSDRLKIDLELGNLSGPEGNVFIILEKIKSAMEQMGLEDEYSEDFQLNKLHSFQEVLVKATKYFNIIAINLPPNFEKTCKEFPVNNLMNKMGYKK